MKGIWAEYMDAARRTQSKYLRSEKKLIHALTGAVSEVGEIIAEWKQGNADALTLEIGDLCWFLAEMSDITKIVPRDGAIQAQIDAYRRFEFGHEEVIAELWTLFKGVYEPIQKSLQGHMMDRDRVRYNMEKLIAILTRLNDGNSISSTKVILDLNVLKLKNRYPDGFDPERSIHRNEP